MKKILLIFLFIPLLNNFTQYTAIVGPSITLVETGSILQATGSYSSSLAMNNVKQGIVDEINTEKICPTVHTSELNEIFFETLEHMDCTYDPMSILR